jgi:hypothetical protein
MLRHRVDSGTWNGGSSETRTPGWLIALPLATLVACAGATGADPPDEPVPTRTFRIDRIQAPSVDDPGIVDVDGDGDLDDEAAFLLEQLFAIYADHGAAEAWQAQLDARLAGDTVWTIELTEEEAVLGDLPLGALADLGGLAVDDGWHPVLGGIVDAAFDVDDQGRMSGWIHGGLAPGYDLVIAEAFLPFLNMFVDDGEASWAEQVDRDDDGVIVLEELQASELFQLLMQPDVDLEGGDGEAESLSFGFPFEAHEAMIVE